MTGLVVHKLSYAYPHGGQVLDQLQFELASGERVGLVGPSGAGKSTLLLHLNGLLPERWPAQPSRAGEAVAPATVTVGELPVVPRNLPAIRRLVGLVFQDPDDQLFGATVAEDVAFGPQQQNLTREQIAARVETALAEVGLAGFGSRLPRELSLGERKRVCLAGVLACHPEILLLDEPTANLDPRARRQLIQLFTSLPYTQLIAGHDLELVVELCSRVLILDGGVLCAAGPPHELLRDAALMERHGLEVPWSLRAR